MFGSVYLFFQFMLNHQSSVSDQLWFSQAEIRSFFSCHFCLASLDGSWLNFPVKSGSIFGVVGTWMSYPSFILWPSRNMNIRDSFGSHLWVFQHRRYTASLCQGIAHNFTGELATLPQLSVIADDLAHTTYFPNLLLQSVLQSVNASLQ